MAESTVLEPQAASSASRSKAAARKAAAHPMRSHEFLQKVGESVYVKRRSAVSGGCGTLQPVAHAFPFGGGGHSIQSRRTPASSKLRSTANSSWLPPLRSCGMRRSSTWGAGAQRRWAYTGQVRGVAAQQIEALPAGLWYPSGAPWRSAHSALHAPDARGVCAAALFRERSDAAGGGNLGPRDGAGRSSTGTPACSRRWSI